MRTITKEIFKFSELSEDAKEKALEYFRTNGTDYYGWLEENRQSIFTFCEHFGVKLKEWSVDLYNYHFSTDAENSHFRGFGKKSLPPADFCPTGYCLDFTLWGEFWRVFEKTGDAKEAFSDAVDAGFKEWRDDWYGFYYEGNSLADFIEANEYEFTETGEVWRV